MAVTIKSKSQIELMRKAGELLAYGLKAVEEAIEPGITTYELDKVFEKFVQKNKVVANFKGLYGFPASLCISVNEELIHGIPSKNKVLKNGDIVSVDGGILYNGFNSDAARTFPVGEISEEAQKLIEVTRESFFEGCQYAKPNHRLHEISAAIQDYVEKHGYSVVIDYVGHGIGRSVHEDPQIPNVRQKNRGIRLAPGMTLAIEPMVNTGRRDVNKLDDNWTIVTADGKLCGHYENTVLITDNGCEFLTLI